MKTLSFLSLFLFILLISCESDDIDNINDDSLNPSDTSLVETDTIIEEPDTIQTDTTVFVEEFRIGDLTEFEVGDSMQLYNFSIPNSEYQLITDTTTVIDLTEISDFFHVGVAYQVKNPSESEHSYLYPDASFVLRSYGNEETTDHFHGYTSDVYVYYGKDGIHYGVNEYSEYGYQLNSISNNPATHRFSNFSAGDILTDQYQHIQEATNSDGRIEFTRSGEISVEALRKVTLHCDQGTFDCMLTLFKNEYSDSIISYDNNGNEIMNEEPEEISTQSYRLVCNELPFDILSINTSVFSDETFIVYSEFF